MKQVSATDVKNNLGTYLDQSQKEPIVITRNGKEFAVLISKADFEAYAKRASLKKLVKKYHDESIEKYEPLYEELAK